MVSNRLAAAVVAAVAMMVMVAALTASCEDQSGGYPTPQLRSVQHG